MTSPKHALSKKRQARPDLAAAGRSHQGLGERLNQMLLSASLPPLDPGQLASFEGQLSLIIRWNARTNITAIRDEEGILSRHFFESIACARTLPAGIRTLLDFGSGAGFPGIPIAIVRPEIAVTLAESQGKKAAFLQEAVRVLNLPRSGSTQAGQKRWMLSSRRLRFAQLTGWRKPCSPRSVSQPPRDGWF
jgi:hypothetical protein